NAIGLAWPAAAHAPAPARSNRPGNGRPVASISAPTNTTTYACSTKASRSGRRASITVRSCKRRATAPCRGLPRERPFLPELPRPRDGAAHRGLGAACLLVVEIRDGAAEGHRLRLQPRVHLGVDTAEDDALQRVADDD